MTHITSTISRRNLLAAGAALPLAGALGGIRPAAAASHAGAPMMTLQNTFDLGEMKVSTLLAGTRPVENPHGIFGLNVGDEEFGEVSAENFIPTDVAQFFFTPTVVQSGGNTILFDTGLNGDGITKALAQAGIAPEDVTHVVLTHMHGDHIGGLMTDGSPTFANAAYLTGQTEYDHWAGTDNEGFMNNVKPLAEKMTFLGDGDSVAPGITGMNAFGHTPGHMAYMLESGGKQLLLMADTANHYVWSLAYPEWEVRFDMDKEMAAQTRKKTFDMLAADKIPLVGYHMPFPAVGYVDTRGDGYRYVPASYQMML